MRATAIYLDPKSVLGRLEQLRISEAALATAVSGALMERLACPPLDPTTAPGFEFWRAGNRILREELMAKPKDRWRPIDDLNVPLIVDVEMGVAITFACGTATTGDPDPFVQPTTKRPKGPILAGIINRNLPRLFENEPRALPTPKGSERMTWILLAYPYGFKARCELSLPMEIQKGTIVKWHERIILPKITLNDTPTPTRRRSDAPRVEVKVVRKI